MSDVLYHACVQACQMLEGEEGRSAWQAYSVLTDATEMYDLEQAERIYNGGYSLSEESAKQPASESRQGSLVETEGRAKVRFGQCAMDSLAEEHAKNAFYHSLVKTMNKDLRVDDGLESDIGLLEMLAANDRSTRHFSNQLAGAARRLRKALATTSLPNAPTT